MTMEKRHKLLRHDQDALADAVENRLLVHVNGVGVDPVDEILILLDKGVVYGGHLGRCVNGLYSE